MFVEGSRRKTVFGTIFRICALLQITVIASFYIFEFLRVEINLLDDNYASYVPFRNMALYFTGQANVFLAFTMLGAFKCIRQRIRFINWKILEFTSMILGFFMFFLYWFYFLVIFRNGVSMDFHGAEIFFNIWLHLIFSIIALAYFWVRSWIYSDWGILRYWKSLWKCAVFPIVYIIVVVILLQLLLADHWSVYQEATLWYHLVDQAQEAQARGREITTGYMLLIIPVYSLLVLMFTRLFNWISAKKSHSPREAHRTLPVYSNRYSRLYADGTMK